MYVYNVHIYYYQQCTSAIKQDEPFLYDVDSENISKALKKLEKYPKKNKIVKLGNNTY